MHINLYFNRKYTTHNVNCNGSCEVARSLYAPFATALSVRYPVWEGWSNTNMKGMQPISPRY